MTVHVHTEESSECFVSAEEEDAANPSVLLQLSPTLPLSDSIEEDTTHFPAMQNLAQVANK